MRNISADMKLITLYKFGCFNDSNPNPSVGPLVKLGQFEISLIICIRVCSWVHRKIYC